MQYLYGYLYCERLVTQGFLSYFIDSMKLKQTVVNFVVVVGMSSFFVAPAVSAAECGGVQTSVISCSESGKVTCTDGKAPTDNKCADGSNPSPVDSNGVWGILKLAIQIMTTGVGILAVGGIVYGSILYTSAGGSSEQTKKAIGIITNVVIGLIAYALMFAITNFLIPGGLFS
ncbi:hypothetical protein D3C85_405220 [compost metagenome]